MFRNTIPDTEPAPVDVMPPAELIPLSVLSLDVDEPVGGWTAYLHGRGVEIVADRIGRSAISAADAKQLLDEQHEAETRQREVAARNEQQAIERDRQMRSRLWGGQPWYEVPHGVSAAEVWAQRERDSRPRRESVLDHALSREEGLTYHPLRDEES
jgi:hypothetical protein